MKTTIIAICLLLAGMLTYSISIPGNKNNKDGKVTVKVITEKDGITTVIDTTISFTGEFTESIVNDLLKTMGLDETTSEGGKCTKKIMVSVNDSGQDGNIKMICSGGDSSLVQMFKGSSFIDDSLIMCCAKGSKCKKMIIKAGDCKMLTDSISKEVRIEVDDNGSIKEFTINGENANPGNYNTDVQVINDGNGKKIIIIKSEVKIDDLDENDLKKLEKSDVANASGKNNLKIEKLDFYPNPNNGKFNLSFTLTEKGKTKITVLNSNGKEVYKEVLPDFTGDYNKAIDISGKGKGLYFLNVEQGNKVMNKKLVIQ